MCRQFAETSDFNTFFCNTISNDNKQDEFASDSNKTTQRFCMIMF